MAGKRREVDLGDQELNLAPIMNLVIILIPMLLLSVVFLQIAVINVTAPKISMGPATPQPEPDKKPLNLTVSIVEKGFFIQSTDVTAPPIPGCPNPGPTICLEKQNVNVESKVKLMQNALQSGKRQKGEDTLDEILGAYNWRVLYNKLAEIKKNFPEETVIKLTAGPQMPYALLVRAMDVSRFKLAKEKYSKNSDFWAADYKKKGANPELMFSDPALARAR